MTTKNRINTTMSVGPAGELTYPLQPCFAAQVTTVKSNVTGDSTAYTIVFETELFDQGNNYDNATGIFTAPVAGHYLFSWNIFYLNNTSTGGLAFRTQIGARIIGDQWLSRHTQSTLYGANGLITSGGCHIIYLAASATIGVAVQADSGAKTDDIYTPSFFSGCLVA